MSGKIFVLFLHRLPGQKSLAGATGQRAAPVWLSMRFFPHVCINKNSILYAHTHTHAETHAHAVSWKNIYFFIIQLHFFPDRSLSLFFSLFAFLFVLFFLQFATCCKQHSFRITNMWRWLHSCKWAMGKNDWLMAA